MTELLNLSTFEANGKTLLKRFTLMIDSGKVEHVFYPVIPPDKSVENVAAL